MDLQDLLGALEQLVLRVQLAMQEVSETQVLLVLQDNQDPLVQMVHLDQLDLQDFKDKLVRLVHRVFLVFLEELVELVMCDKQLSKYEEIILIYLYESVALAILTGFQL